MPRYSSTIDMLFARMPEDVRQLVNQRVFNALSEDELAEMALRDTTTTDVLEMLATSTRAKVRVAVAFNLNCPPSVLQVLSTDKAKTVSAAAQRHLLWLDLTAPEAGVPKHTREKAAQLEIFLVRDHPWTSVPGTKDVLGRLLSDDAWLADHKFVSMCYGTLAEMDAELLQAIGPGRFMRALLAGLPKRYDYEAALEWLWEQLSTPEFLKAIQDNEDVLTAKVAREVGAKWKKLPLDAFDGNHPDGWFRVGLASCPDKVLLEAFDSESEMLMSIAAANAQQRPHLKGKVIEHLVELWEEYSELNVPVLEALDDDALLDLPMELLAHARTLYEDAEALERARSAVAQAVSEILKERPDAWDILQVIGDDYEGSARELLAALRNL